MTDNAFPAQCIINKVHGLGGNQSRWINYSEQRSEHRSTKHRGQRDIRLIGGQWEAHKKFFSFDLFCVEFSVPRHFCVCVWLSKIFVSIPLRLRLNSSGRRNSDRQLLWLLHSSRCCDEPCAVSSQPRDPSSSTTSQFVQCAQGDHQQIISHRREEAAHIPRVPIPHSAVH